MKIFFKKVIHRIGSDDVMGLAAQLAYFFLLALFPFLLFLVTLIGYLPIDHNSVMDFMASYAPPEIMNFINENLTLIVNNQQGGLLSIGIIGTIWSASNGTKAIMKALNRAHEIEDDRSFLIGRSIAIILTIAMVIVISVAFLLPIFGKLIGEAIFSFFGLTSSFVVIWSFMRWLISSVIIFIVLVFLYKLAPNKRITFRSTIWGAIFATIGWQIVSLGFSYYVTEMGNYSATYGSLGAIIVLMIWFYITGIIILIGGVINASLNPDYRTKSD